MLQRAEYLALRYYFKIRANLSNPAFDATTYLNDSLLFTNLDIAKPLSLRIEDMKNKFNILSIPIMPQFSYQLLSIDRPTSTLRKIAINLDLNSFPKATTPPVQYLQAFRELCTERYHGFYKIYTDGSKSEHGVGAACYSSQFSKSTSLPSVATIYFAEMYAIWLALLSVDNSHSKYVIFSDSFSSLLSLKNHNSNHPLVRKIIHKLSKFHQTGKTIELCWIPSHTGIEGNSQADKLAVTVARTPEKFVPIYYQDVFPKLKKIINNHNNQEWTRKNQKLGEIKRDLQEWPPTSLSRKEEIIVNRLRAGHCFFSHQFMMNDSGPVVAPVCMFCSQEVISVKHILVECNQLIHERRTYMPSSSSETNNLSLSNILGEHANLKEVINFVKNIGLYNLI